MYHDSPIQHVIISSLEINVPNKIAFHRARQYPSTDIEVTCMNVHIDSDEKQLR